VNMRQESEELQVVVFNVGGHDFAIAIAVVREIINVTKLVALPDMPSSMVGIINVRGNVLPIVDLKSRFALGRSSASEDANQKILLVDLEGSMVGFLVDSVSEVLRVSRKSLESIEKIPGINVNLVDSICKDGDRLIPIVNATELFTVQETQQLQNAVKERAHCSVI